MKPVLLFCVLAVASVTMAAPARKRVVWEYATLDLAASERVSSSFYKYGARLFLPGGKTLFLEAKNHESSSYRNYLLNRLGSQGWELVAVAGNRGNEYKYIFKRQK